MNEIQYRWLMIKGHCYHARNSFYQWVAFCLPYQIMYWAFIRGAAIATTEKYASTDPTTLGVMEALDRLDPLKRKP